MFHFPTFPPHALCVQARVTPHDWCGVPPFGNPRINARLTAPRGLSQPPTSFIGSWCQGIHRAPLTTWPHKNTAHPSARKDTGVRAYKNSAIRVKRCSRPLCSSQRTTRHRSPDPTRPTPTQKAAQRYEAQTGPDREETNPHTGMARSLRTQQRAYDRPSPPTPFPAPHPANEERCRTRSSHGCRPNWSAFHPRAPPQEPAAPRDWETITSWARLWTTHTR